MLKVSLVNFIAVSKVVYIVIFKYLKKIIDDVI